MDSRNIEKLMAVRERGYIWLEKELKRVLAESASVILMLFLFTLIFLDIKIIGIHYIILSFAMLLAANIIIGYKRYKRIYKSYKTIYEYLEQFEEGNYDYHIDGEFIKEGIHSQIIEQLEKLALSFGTMKERITYEKESTKVLVTDISHQLKTPLSALRMSLDLMDDESATSEEKSEFLLRSKDEVQKLEYLLGTLTNLSRLEADMIQIKALKAGIKNTIIDAVNSVYMKAYQKQIEIEMEEFPDIILLHDKKWTTEALINVLDNAVKYSEESTAISIRVEERISYILIEIEDSGVGIPKEEYPYIFKRFYRGKGTLVEKSEGSGVGLYLVRRILEEQGGSIRVIPARRQGSIFQMMLPKEYYSK